MVMVKFKKLHPDAITFSYTRDNDACMDMFALIDEHIIPGDTKIIPTGIAVEIPKGYEGIVRGRSGFASRGFLIHTGTIDEEYRGDIGIIITNLSNVSLRINKGTRLSQFTIKPVYKIKLIEQLELSNTNRGSNGYGSSGI